MLQVLWNCILFLLLLGLFKASLGLRWRWIGAWKYHELHSSLVYDESSSVKQFLVNFIFFLVYPGVLAYRCYQAEARHGWVQEDDDLVELIVDKGLGEDELLRRGKLRGRMIIQKQIILNDSQEEDLEVTQGAVPEDDDDETEEDSFELSVQGGRNDDEEDEEDNGSYEESEKPLNLSKDCPLARRRAELRHDFVSEEESDDSVDREMLQSTLINTQHEFSSTSTIKNFK
ncbi:uncharacterized protein LOC118456859 [Anopheles albimanus]|uniref:uncharacterized protein LOC118456859 n=1 Tax=Anopheles albimanus TaxID=7167 RepID=UPI0016411B90|nr:uncharacterized protein LOC118456859 [Anopheles albimanus]